MLASLSAFDNMHLFARFVAPVVQIYARLCAGFFMLEKRLSPHRRGYDRAWQRLRRLVLSEDPFCRLCALRGRTVQATVADHIQPISAAPHLRLDRSNIQPLCKPCHDSVKQSQERTGHLRGADANGMPLDPNHHWYKG